MMRTAVVVGCQYPKLKDKLVGSLTNAHNMALILRDNFDVSDDRITILINDDPSDTGSGQPTGENIRNAIQSMVDQCGEGELLFFYISGHGGLFEASTDFPEEEYIVPPDHNFITSQEFRGWVDQLPSGACLVVISESSQSGGLIGQEKEQIGAPDSINRSQGFLSLESSIEHLASLSNIKSPNVGDHLRFLFGNKVSPRFSSSPQPYVLQLTKPDDGILLSACTPHESAFFKTTNPTYGYFTNALEKAMREKDFIITNKQLVMRTRELVLAQKIPQHPCLYCSDNNVDKRFFF